MQPAPERAAPCHRWHRITPAACVAARICHWPPPTTAVAAALPASLSVEFEDRGLPPKKFLKLWRPVVMVVADA